MADNLTEKLKGTVKEMAGHVLGDKDAEKEGQAQQEKARDLEKAEAKEAEAAEKRREAARHEGTQRAKE